MYQMMAKPQTRGEEGADHADRRRQRHFDRLVIGLVDQLVLLDRRLLASPIGLFAVDVGKHREIVVRRRRQGQPFERPAVPWVAGDVAALVARLDRIEQLDDRQDDAKADDRRADERDVQPRLPRLGSEMCCIRRVAPQKPST